MKQMIKTKYRSPLCHLHGQHPVRIYHNISKITNKIIESKLTARKRPNRHAFNLANTQGRLKNIEYFESASLMQNTSTGRFANSLAIQSASRCVQRK